MQRRNGSAGAAIQRQQKHIEGELKSGKKKNTIRLALIARGVIPEVSRAYFNEVVGDFSAPKPASKSGMTQVSGEGDARAASDESVPVERPDTMPPSIERRGGNYVDDRFDNAL